MLTQPTSPKIEERIIARFNAIEIYLLYMPSPFCTVRRKRDRTIYQQLELFVCKRSQADKRKKKLITNIFIFVQLNVSLFARSVEKLN